MKTVTMKSLRESFKAVRTGLKKGTTYLLMYRSKPLAVLEPYDAKKHSNALRQSQNLPVVDIDQPMSPAIKIPTAVSQSKKQPVYLRFNLKKIFVP